MKEQLAYGVSKDEFINRVRKVLGAPPIPGAAQATTTTPQASTPEPAISPSPATPASHSPIPDAAPSPIATPPLSSKAKGKQRAPSPKPNPEASSAKAAQQSAREALRKKKQEEKEELERIKARIEADRAERKAQAETRKAERERERLAQSPPTASQLPIKTSTRGSNAKEVHLNVRLFDGRTIRSTFQRTAKLQDDVRPWIDQEVAARAEDSRERHPPYFFRQILAPLPNRELSAGDETETLGDIDLAPSATLVLVPVKGYTEAYSGGSTGIVYGAAGNVMGLVGGAFNLAGSAIGYVGSALGSVVGYGGTNAQQQQEQTQEQSSSGRALGATQQENAGTANIRVRTLADQRAGEPRSEQLYNGNQVREAFDPRLS